MNFAIIGTNFISDLFCQAAEMVNDAEILAVYSRKNDTGCIFKQKNNVKKVYTDLDEMLSDDEIDAVYVASPTFLHKEHTVAALKAGKHVLCEKMIAINSKELQEMKTEAIKSGKVLLEAMRPMFDPALTVIKNALPRLGKIRRVSFEYCQYSSRYNRFLKGELPNAFNPKLNNSALADIGIYPLYVLTELFGEPTSLKSESVFIKGGFEGCGTVLMKYQDMTATVNYSKITDSTNPSIIEGELGTLSIDKISSPKDLTMHLRGEKSFKLPHLYRENNMSFEIEEFIRLCQGNGNYLNRLSVTEAVMRTIDKVYLASGFTAPYTVI